MATPESLGISTAQLWDTSATNKAFEDVVKQHNLDKEQERKDAEMADKKAQKEEAMRQKFIRDELAGYSPDMSNIFESRDGDTLRKHVQEGYAKLLAEPGFGTRLYNGEPEAMKQWQMYKMGIAGEIAKSSQDKVDAADKRELAQEYAQSVAQGLPWTNEDYYEEDARAAWETINTPLADIASVSERGDFMGDWMKFVDMKNKNFDSQHQDKRSGYSAERGVKYTRSGAERDAAGRADLVSEFWDTEAGEKEIRYRLGLRWDDDSDESEAQIAQFKKEREEEARHNTTERGTWEDELDIPEGSTEEEIGYHRIDEMTRVLQKQPHKGANAIPLNDPAYSAYVDDEGNNLFDTDKGALGHLKLVRPTSDSAINVLGVMTASPEVADAKLVVNTKDLTHKILIRDNKGNISLIEPSEYSKIAKTLSRGEGIKDWSLDKQDKINKAKRSGTVDAKTRAQELINKYRPQ